MGWKLAGFDVVGGCEIDADQAALYIDNLGTEEKPATIYRVPIQEFRQIPELPSELEGLDVLDGSPPCSTFSMAGNREKDWGVERSFREGQFEQRLDDLFFHFIALARRLRPRVVVAENVRGMLAGNARGYVKEIFRAFNEAGYDVQLWDLDGGRLGVPQRRGRIFFVARRRDLGLPPAEIPASEREVTVGEATEGLVTAGNPLSGKAAWLWGQVEAGDGFSKATGRKSWFNWFRVSSRVPAPTVLANGPFLTHWEVPAVLSNAALARIGSFPDDYRYGRTKPVYAIGMSVPPLMMQRVALSVARMLLRRLDADPHAATGR